MKAPDAAHYLSVYLNMVREVLSLPPKDRPDRDDRAIERAFRKIPKQPFESPEDPKWRKV